MLTAVKGYYEKGNIVLKETAPVTEKTDVIVTFLNEPAFESPQTENSRKKNEIVFGSLKGKIHLPEDFDEPLEDLKDYM